MSEYIVSVPKRYFNPRGVLKFGFGRDVPPREFESRPIQIPVFQEKVTHSYTNRLNFGSNFEQKYRLFPKFS